MKKTLLSLLVVLGFATQVRADEGMWFLKMMEEQHLEDSLRKAGLQLPASALYNENGPSLRDCIGIFGGGCTGEIVSPDGLVFTNHHCGFSYVHEMSDLNHNYIKDGFFAQSRSEELRSPESLTFTFIIGIEDVTEQIRKEGAKQKKDIYTMQSQRFLEPIAKNFLKKGKYKKAKGVTAEIYPFYAANRFYLFYKQTYLDVRLVATPPNNVGQFGGNTDNWMWPRQNADFAVFRIYADKDGQPAPYSADNVPLHRDKFLPISLKGVKENDYTMIMGFPGRTSRYLTASQVKLRTQDSNAPIVAAGNPLLDYYKKLMDQSDAMRLKIEDQHFGYGNMIKNYGGMNESVEKVRLLDDKAKEEAAFRAFAKKSGVKEYENIIDRIDSLCEATKDAVHDFNLAFMALGAGFTQLDTDCVDDYVKAVKSGDKDAIEEASTKLRNSCAENCSALNAEIDRGAIEILLPIFFKEKRIKDCPDVLSADMDFKAFARNLYVESVFTDSARLAKAFETADTTALKNDLLYRATFSFGKYTNRLRQAQGDRSAAAELNHIYVRGLCEMYGWTKAPDANFTMRMTYGHICDLKPRDAVRYDWRTVLDGMFEKESKTESDYFINEKLRKLYLAKDFGPYAREDGKLPTCFLSNNDITGGNSGSAVLNNKGELIGLAFDGNIESLSSDLKFNPQLQRCINVDVRFILFILDKFGGSKYLLDELELRK